MYRGTEHPLDRVVLSSLTGGHARFARTRGRVVSYPPDVTPFADLPPDADERDWLDLAALWGPGGTVGLAGDRREHPMGWPVALDLPGLQFDGTGLAVRPDPEAVVLGPADAAEMLDLVERTRPGPFLARTVELGCYLGIRRGGALVAMAGERLRPRGWSEISAVCTDPDHRGQGLAARLVRAVGAVIRARGDVPFLHTAADNDAAVRLYLDLGFTLRRKVVFAAYDVPVDGAQPASPVLG